MDITPRGGRLDERTGVLELDIGGVVGVRLEGPDREDLRGVHRQIGVLNRPLEGRPADVVIRFGDVRDPGSRLRFLGQRDGAYSEAGFWLWADGDTPVRLEVDGRLPFRLHVPSGISRIPLLVYLISAAALRQGLIPLHASAVRWRGRGVVLAGWSKGGKTEALLAFMERGADYVGDEWMFLSPTTGRVHGLPEPMRVWDWHLGAAPALRRRIPPRTRAKLVGLKAAEQLLSSAPGATATKAARLLGRQRYVQVDPADAFGRDRYVRESPVDVLFLMTASQSNTTTAQSVDPSATGQRLATSSSFEHLRLLEAELKAQFASPGRGTPLWDRLAGTRPELAAAIDSVPIFEVCHPYPASFDALFEVIAPIVEAVEH